MYFTGAEHQLEDLSLASTIFVIAVQGQQSQPAPCCIGGIASLAPALLGILGLLQNTPARKHKHPRTGTRFIFITAGSHITYSDHFLLLKHSKYNDYCKNRAVSHRLIIPCLWAYFVVFSEHCLSWFKVIPSNKFVLPALQWVWLESQFKLMCYSLFTLTSCNPDSPEQLDQLRLYLILLSTPPLLWPKEHVITE